jgi:microcin C transport system substrate-binding protein
MQSITAVIAVVLAGTFLATAAMAEPRHGIAMHGEPKYGPDFTHFDYVNPHAPKGGDVRLGDLGSFDNLNQFIIKGQSAGGLGLIYDSLMTSSMDEPFTMYGLLAETIETPEDRSWVAFTLRENARWHDGKPVTPEDVIFTFNMLREKGQPVYRFYYGNVATVEKTGERTVKFSFSPGENRELPLILGQLVVLPKHYWEARDFSKTTLDAPLGSGPYKIEAVDAGRSITYRRIEDYWGRDLPVNVGMSNFGTLRYDYYRDSVVAIEALKAGEFDYRDEFSSKSWATAYDTPALKEGLLRKREVEHRQTAGMQGYVFNTRRGMFKDRRVRQALGFGFDFEWSNRNLFHGQYKRTRSYFDNSELSAIGLPDERELAILEKYRGRIPDEVFTQAYEPPKTDGMGRIRKSLRQGDKLLKEAGWIIKDGARAHGETGAPLEFEVLLVSPSFERISLPFAKNLERLGVKVRVRTVDSSQYLRRLETFDYDVIVFNFGQSMSPGNEQRYFWGSAAADRPGSRNFIGIKDPVIDELIEAVIAAPDRESLVLRTRVLDRVLQWGHYVVPHFHINRDRLVFWDKFGWPEVAPMRGSVFTAWWVDAERAAALAQRRGTGATK